MVDVFMAQGVSDDDAAICAEALITSDLRGIEPHGIGRLKYYYDRNRGHPYHAKMEIVKETETTALVDGTTMGHPTAYRSMVPAIRKAREYGDRGRGGSECHAFRHRGLLSNGGEGGHGQPGCHQRAALDVTDSLGVQPIRERTPSPAPFDMAFPFCFDGATTIAQRGKIEVAARAEKPVPAGWVIDDQGRDMTDPDAILEAYEGDRIDAAPGRRRGGDAATRGGLAVIVEILSAHPPVGLSCTVCRA